MMKLSIIIPCYKVEKYLDTCLESVTRNKSEDVEIILVDDGSPDRVPQMCDEWSQKDERIRVIHQNNGGLSVARNTGIDNSTGEYLWFIDSDDKVTDDAINTVIRLIEKNPQVDVFVTPLLWTYHNSQKNWMDIIINDNIQINGNDYLKKYPRGGTPRNIFRRELINAYQIRFCPGILHEDALFGMFLYYHAKHVMVLKDYLYVYYQNEGSIMHNITMKSAYSFMVIHKKLMEHMERYAPLEDYKMFRQKGIGYIHCAITSTWHLRHTKEFQRFLEETKEYRIRECTKCAELGSTWIEKINPRLLAYYPIFYNYYRNWQTLLRRKIGKFLNNNNPIC